MFLKKMNKNILNIILLFFIIYFVFVFMYFFYSNSKKMKEMKEMKEMKKMKEGLNNIHVDTNLSSDFAKSFCESSNASGADLQTECQRLTQDNCRSTSCCIWASNQKCYAGGKDGLLFNNGPNGKPISLDYYYYKDTCYGKNCTKM